MKKPVSIYYSRAAEKDLSKLNRALAGRILKKIVENTQQPNVLIRAKALTGRFTGSYRYRVGEYRVIFMIDDEGSIMILTILSVKHRKDIYR